MVQNRAGGHVQVLAVAAPQRGWSSYWCVAIAQRRRVGVHVGCRAVAELTPQAQIAMAARQVLLDCDPVTLSDAPAASEGLPRSGDGTHVLVAKDARRRAHT